MTNKLYHAASLEDIAKMFDEKSKIELKKSKKSDSVWYSEQCYIEANTWEAAAEILRQTELDIHQPINEAYSFIDEASNITTEMLIGSYVAVLNNSCHAEGHPAQADVDKIMKDG